MAIATATKIDPAIIFKEAHDLGHAAAMAVTPTPMIVEQRARIFDDSSPVVKSWQINDGVCGFALVRIKPANCAFAKWLLRTRRVYKSEVGGVCYSISDYRQSLTRKEAYAHAFAAHLRRCGINAHSESRID